MNKDIKRAWVKALRSGKYKQGRKQLRNAHNEMCCLGVLCNLHAEAHPRTAAAQTSPIAYMGRTEYPPKAVFKWAGDSTEKLRILAKRNDGGATFANLADMIEREF